MRFKLFLVAAVLLSGVVLPSAQAEEGQLDPAPPKGITSDEIIQRFAAKEKEFKAALDQYSYRQDVRVTTPEDDGQYRQVFDVSFDDQGHKVKNVILAP
jgi:hypothetical protein